MKNSRILPAELAEYTYEHHFKRMNVQSRTIYVIVLIFLVLSSGALLLISVNVIVRGAGVLTAAADRTWIKAPVSGPVASVHVEENQSIVKGAILFTMESGILDEDLSYLRQKMAEIRAKITDLRKLIAICRENKLAAPGTLLSPVYVLQYRLFAQRARGIRNQVKETEATYLRNDYLYQEGVVAKAEFERHRFALQEVEDKLQLLYRDQGNSWQADLNLLTQELRELASAESKLIKQKESYRVRAPTDGILQELTGLIPGTFLNQGERVARLSPDSGLLARIPVSPADIGLIEEGMPVRIQVDAFNYQQWGLLTGVVSTISRDVLFTPGRDPFFEVICELQDTVLQLDNGYRGRLKRGMTIQARFLVARRTLFQLLSDNIDNWLNPYEQSPG